MRDVLSDIEDLGHTFVPDRERRQNWRLPGDDHLVDVAGRRRDRADYCVRPGFELRLGASTHSTLGEDRHPRSMISSAALLLREHGVAGTAFASVLRESDAPRGSLGHHFPGGKREMIAEAIRLAGGAASTAMRNAAERGDSPAELFSMVCRFYRRALVDSEVAAACPVGAVAVEAHDDPVLRTAAAEVFDEWRMLLGAALVADGRDTEEAADLSEACIAGLEGALMTARVAQSAAPIDRVERALTGLLG